MADDLADWRPAMARIRPLRPDRGRPTRKQVVRQQNTFTGRLTEDMLDAVFERAKQIRAESEG